MPKIVTNCTLCNKEITRNVSQSVTSKHFFCCVAHKNQFFTNLSFEERFGEDVAKERRAKMSEANRGENNPNYGKRWTNEQRKQASERTKQFFADNPDVAYECGKTNRGRKLSRETILKMHSGRTRESYQRPPNEERRRLIGAKSAAKWTPEYKQQHREMMEQQGRWVPLAQKSKWSIYQKESNWVEKMWDLVDDPRNLLKECGIFHNKTNTKGVVRDHILSRKTGFALQVFPEIIRHPANCQILLHSENVKKKTGRYVDRDDISLEQLFEAIRNFSKSWKEQNLVLNLIEKYEQGQRYQYEHN